MHAGHDDLSFLSFLSFLFFPFFSFPSLSCPFYRFNQHLPSFFLNFFSPPLAGRQAERQKGITGQARSDRQTDRSGQVSKRSLYGTGQDRKGASGAGGGSCQEGPNSLLHIKSTVVVQSNPIQSNPIQSNPIYFTHNPSPFELPKRKPHKTFIVVFPPVVASLANSTYFLASAGGGCHKYVVGIDLRERESSIVCPV
ncbi:hypothetical protein IWZ03DRAFT_38117 [Phyllosticta citriasiana]|uniref:Uncharacterized protein n=1 Tax=Phyllosticta citriasiana TaxID=595635 RepID=A0ABR1KD83_9PEZI